MQREFHPDVNKDKLANEAFTKVTALFEGPDYKLRVASGTATDNHMITWSMEKDFGDLKAPAVKALEKLSTLPDEFSRFFPKLKDYGPDHLTTSYGEGWWFMEDFPAFDSRTVVWIAKRGAAAIIKASEKGLVHGDINSRTIVLLPSEHGLMLDGWWASVPVGERIQIKPTGRTPNKYFGGAPADESMMVAQLASVLTIKSNPDKLLLETFKKYAVAGGKAKAFFKEVDDVAKGLYGPPSWHELSNPTVPMI